MFNGQTHIFDTFHPNIFVQDPLEPILTDQLS